ncbi:3-methyladenine DNA glycosylase AlkD [Microbacterium sp. AK009]|uniref:DNA alkylation repair protein n=1 Tax=Microbacterium sp. AK009 TaxID=2723068 RepID=UPI0015C97807|nr:DNA alkylation repair protein [Microbacterium sp. AK009]NYF16138.1 3-methyladenine DNA glycosylase AlkD [Microbacterium sp. AK009]
MSDSAAEAALVRDIRAALRKAADPSRAAGQQAYMKSAMPFLGIRVPEVRRLVAEVANSAGPVTRLSAARLLWDDATHREERYAAMALLRHRGVRGEPRLVPIVEHMVRTGAWWDITDELAHRLGDLLDARPDETAVIVRAWAHDDDLWIRRIAILSQLGRRRRVDQALLDEAISPNAADSEFFIRKAIGWALRDHARTDPAWVRAFVAAHDLSPLSVREALKHLGTPQLAVDAASASTAAPTMTGAPTSPRSA